MKFDRNTELHHTSDMYCDLNYWFVAELFRIGSFKRYYNVKQLCTMNQNEWTVQLSFSFFAIDFIEIKTP